MEAIYNIALFTHIAGGGIALLAGFFAMIARKGGSGHAKTGYTFYYSTLAVALTALFMAVYSNKPFLLHIGLFTLYQNLAGMRSVRIKSLRPTSIDWLLALVGLVNGGFMLASGNIVLMVFGGINTFLVLQDLRMYWQLAQGTTLPKNSWMRRHLGMMIGTYIAIFTAFLVVNSEGQLWIWLGPTAAFMPIMIYWNVRVAKNTVYRRGPAQAKVLAPLMLLALLLAVPQLLSAQSYVDGGNTRHRFAQITLGASHRLYPGGGTQWRTDAANPAAGLQAEAFAPHQSTRLVIGGTHFWGHADFLVSFPILQSQTGYTERIETSFRYMPWRVESGKIRPYVGLSHQVTAYRKGAGALISGHRIPLSAGLYYLHGSHLWELGATYFGAHERDYYFSSQQQARVQMPAMAFSLGYKWMFDTTLGAEKGWKSGRTAYLTDTLAKLDRLDGFTFGVGPSAGFFLTPSQNLTAAAPWLGQHRGGMMLELMAGYYWHQPDLQLSLLYRGMNSEISAYGSEQQLQRRAVTLEAYHFFADYHGFVPYVGAALSYENWQSRSSFDGGTALEGSHQSLQPGLSAGWDIRPDRLQRWYLRTSLRYFPLQRLNLPNGRQQRVDQLEVNFIQLVILPGRFKW